MYILEIKKVFSNGQKKSCFLCVLSFLLTNRVLFPIKEIDSISGKVVVTLGTAVTHHRNNRNMVHGYNAEGRENKKILRFLC